MAILSEVLAQTTETASKRRESKAENITVPLNTSQDVNLHLDHYVQLWPFQHHRKKVIVAWEKTPRKGTGIMSNSKQLYQENTMNLLRTFSLKTGRKKKKKDWLLIILYNSLDLVLPKKKKKKNLNPKGIHNAQLNCRTHHCIMFQCESTSRPKCWWDSHGEKIHGKLFNRETLVQTVPKVSKVQTARH